MKRDCGSSGNAAAGDHDLSFNSITVRTRHVDMDMDMGLQNLFCKALLLY